MQFPQNCKHSLLKELDVIHDVVLGFKAVVDISHLDLKPMICIIGNVQFHKITNHVVIPP